MADIFDQAACIAMEKLRPSPKISIMIAMQGGGGLSDVQKTMNIAGQPHKLAYITPDESSLLKQLGGSGQKVNGIPAYFGDEDEDFGDQGWDDPEDAGGSSLAEDEAQYADLAAQMARDAAIRDEARADNVALSLALMSPPRGPTQEGLTVTDVTRGMGPSFGEGLVNVVINSLLGVVPGVNIAQAGLFLARQKNIGAHLTDTRGFFEEYQEYGKPRAFDPEKDSAAARAAQKAAQAEAYDPYGYMAEAEAEFMDPGYLDDAYSGDVDDTSTEEEPEKIVLKEKEPSAMRAFFNRNLKTEDEDEDTIGNTGLRIAGLNPSEQDILRNIYAKVGGSLAVQARKKFKERREAAISKKPGGYKSPHKKVSPALEGDLNRLLKKKKVT